MITKNGKEISRILNIAGMEWEWENSNAVLDTLSLICRHTVTYTRLHEIFAGNATHSGEWVNAHYEWLTKRDQQLETRLADLGRELAGYVSAGSPRLETHSLYGVTITVTDSHGIPRTRDMGK
jgi:uncharacterized lipoprotein YmbA